MTREMLKAKIVETLNEIENLYNSGCIEEAVELENEVEDMVNIYEEMV